MALNIVAYKDMQTCKHENLCSPILEKTFRINTEFLCSTLQKERNGRVKIPWDKGYYKRHSSEIEDEAWEI